MTASDLKLNSKAFEQTFLSNSAVPHPQLLFLLVFILCSGVRLPKPFTQQSGFV